MRVGVIASEMERKSTGVGRYLSGMLHGLTRWDHGLEWVLYFQGEPFDHELFEHPAFKPVFSGFGGHPVVWEQAVLPWRIKSSGVDLLFAPAFTVPFGLEVPVVVVIHDLAFELLPCEFGWRERWRRRLLARRASRIAARVLTDGGWTAEQLRRLYGVDRGRIGVVPLGVDVGLLPEPAGAGADCLSALGVRPPFLLVVGTILERRMPRLVLDTFAALKTERPNLQLVLAGDNRMRVPGDLGGWISELGVEEDVRVLGWVEDGLLPDLYTGAELTLYLSSYEGFGIPPFESLAFQTPAVVGAGLALDEIWPDYPYRITSYDVPDVVDVVRRILDRPAEVESVMADAKPVLERTGWEESSRRLVAELGKAVAP
jgi:glycosyltransferase involved in cell wall biosynthesis